MMYCVDWPNGDAMDIEADNDEQALVIIQELIEEGCDKPERVYRYKGDEQIDIYW